MAWIGFHIEEADEKVLLTIRKEIGKWKSGREKYENLSQVAERLYKIQLEIEWEKVKAAPVQLSDPNATTLPA
jgi:hypothetical protein